MFFFIQFSFEDGDLDQFLKTLRRQRNRLQVDQVIDLFIQLLSAVEFLHAKRILHRDIKTSNIFLKRNQLRLGDFGISRLMMHTLDKASTFIGTPFYMSPETLRYDGYNMKSDIWFDHSNSIVFQSENLDVFFSSGRWAVFSTS